MEVKSLVVAAPAAGVEPFVVVPANEVWTLHSLRAFYTTDASVPIREVRFIIDDPSAPGLTYVFIPSAVSQAPSETRTYQFLKDGGYRGAGAINVGVVVGVGDLKVPAGFRIRLSVTNLQPGDQFTATYLLYEAALA